MYYSYSKVFASKVLYKFMHFEIMHLLINFHVERFCGEDLSA